MHVFAPIVGTLPQDLHNHVTYVVPLLRHFSPHLLVPPPPMTSTTSLTTPRHHIAAVEYASVVPFHGNVWTDPNFARSPQNRLLSIPPHHTFAQNGLRAVVKAEPGKNGRKYLRVLFGIYKLGSPGNGRSSQ